MNLKITSLALALSVVFVAGCSSDSSEDGNDQTQNETTDETTDETPSETTDETPTGTDETTAGAPDPSLFSDGALAADVTTEDCTLSDGTNTTCYSITIAGAPADGSQEGPYCPTSINSTAEEVGTWMDGVSTVYDVDGDFILDMQNIYNDTNWQMYDPDTGLVDVISGAEGCEVSGIPENSTGRDNFCLECSLEFIDGGVERTALIPVTPVALGAATDIGGTNIGIALNGVLLGPPAPLALILSGYTLGVLDDCGAHANPHEGYHYHSANGCSEVGIQDDGHGALIGYALDGYGVYAREDTSGNISTTLDECGGETDDTRGYHYHASVAGSNEIIGCYMGAQGSISGDNAGGGGPPGGGPPGGAVPTNILGEY